MKKQPNISCRAVACREVSRDGNQWSFYLINDGEEPIDSAVLTEVGYEWGHVANYETADVHVNNLAAGAHALVWRDDGSGAELRMDLLFRVRMARHEESLRFEFPKLYRKKNLPLVPGLGKPGWEGAPGR